MTTEDAIEQLSTALSLLNEPVLDKEAMRTLTRGLLDAKHTRYLDEGLATSDKGLIAHAILGALSHHEAEKEKNAREKLSFRH